MNAAMVSMRISLMLAYVFLPACAVAQQADGEAEGSNSTCAGVLHDKQGDVLLLYLTLSGIYFSVKFAKLAISFCLLCLKAKGGNCAANHAPGSKLPHQCDWSQQPKQRQEIEQIAVTLSGECFYKVSCRHVAGRRGRHVNVYRPCKDCQPVGPTGR